MGTNAPEAVYEKAFIKFCRKSIENAAIDFDRVQKRRREKEKLFTELAPSQEEMLSVKSPNDEYCPVFQVMGNSTPIESDQIHHALLGLSELRRKIVTLYYFHHMSDREIGIELNMNRRTVNFNRGSALVQMKGYLEVLMYGT